MIQNYFVQSVDKVQKRAWSQGGKESHPVQTQSDQAEQEGAPTMWIPADEPFMIFDSASEHRAVTGRRRRTEGKQGSSAYIRGLHCELQSCP